MTITEQKLELAKDKIGNVLHHHRCAYVNGISLRDLYADKERVFLASLSQHSAPQVLRIPNCHSHVHHLTVSAMGGDFGTLKILLDLSEASAEFKEAYQILQPLVDRVAELEAEIEDERLVAAEASNKLRDAVEAARLAAEEKLAKDPAVLAAQKAFEAAQPALVPAPTPDIVLTRGKVKLEAVPA